MDQAHEPAHILCPPSNISDPTADCACSTVTYSMMQACQVCQFNASGGPGVLGWPQFSEKCQRKTVRNYPRPLLPGTSVPAWAFQDVAQSGTFDIETAQRVAKADLPDTTSFPLPPSSAVSTLVLPSSTIRTSWIVPTSPSLRRRTSHQPRYYLRAHRLHLARLSRLGASRYFPLSKSRRPPVVSRFTHRSAH
ncbi:hypothetical protein C8Q74DRAFT_134333 [Fomes fomentarius]|nr:hypothetical protein C8Q74DRAFT_134333 [Fomes fomentarius]